MNTHFFFGMEWAFGILTGFLIRFDFGILCFRVGQKIC